jgi:hypothetical protein
MEALVTWILHSATKLLLKVLSQLHLCGGDMLVYKRKPLDLGTEYHLLGLITAYTLFGSKRRILMMQLVRH